MFRHTDGLVPHHQHIGRADHAHVHITHIVDEVKSGQPLRQDRKSAFNAGLGVNHLGVGSARQPPGGQAKGLGYLGMDSQAQTHFGTAHTQFGGIHIKDAKVAAQAAGCARPAQLHQQQAHQPLSKDLNDGACQRNGTGCAGLGHRAGDLRHEQVGGHKHPVDHVGGKDKG